MNSDSVFDDPAREGCSVRSIQLIGGKEMELQVVSGFFLDSGGGPGAGWKVPGFRAFDKHGQINIAERMDPTFDLGAKEKGACHAGGPSQNLHRLDRSAAN
jgi:hypothetical protein